MSDRAQMDRPAAVVALALGVILIFISVPLLAAGNDSGNETYTVTWREVTASSGTGSQAAAGQTARVTAQVTDVLPSNVTVTLTCNDNRGPGNLAAPAQVTWTLKSGTETLASGTDCTGGTTALQGHPDVAEVQAGSLSEAVKKVWAKADNVTLADYVLEFSWTRAGSTGPLPVPPQGTSFTATVAVEVLQWDILVAKKTAEVGK